MVFFRRLLLFGLILFRFGRGFVCFSPTENGKGAVLGIFYHRFLLLSQQNWPLLQSAGPLSWKMTKKSPTCYYVLRGVPAWFRGPGLCWWRQRALRLPLRWGSWGLSTRKQEPAQGGPALLSPASSFSLLCHLFPVWVQFCTLNSATTCLPDSSILLIITFLFLNLVIAPALPSHFSLLK